MIFLLSFLLSVLSTCFRLLNSEIGNDQKLIKVMNMIEFDRQFSSP